MESAIPMFLFFGSLTLFGMLIIWAGYQSRELERRDQALAAEPTAAGEDSFLAEPEPTEEEALTPVFRLLDGYLHRQRLEAESFVNEPDLDKLLARAEQELAPELLDRVEAFLRREFLAARTYVSSPNRDLLQSAAAGAA
ncbi:MAG: hypothetical protein D6702_07575 [Planctomycetota bacterium]|nr:MAG: hypothetical protein D6702_07575 [Planctomycetota bacterium]